MQQGQQELIQAYTAVVVPQQYKHWLCLNKARLLHTFALRHGFSDPVDDVSKALGAHVLIQGAVVVDNVGTQLPMVAP
jgi:hypothetical protein